LRANKGIAQDFKYPLTSVHMYMMLAFHMSLLHLIAFQGAGAVAVVESDHMGHLKPGQRSPHGMVESLPTEVFNAELDGSADIHFAKSAEDNLQLSELQASSDKRLVRRSESHEYSKHDSWDGENEVTPLRVNANATTWSVNMRQWIDSAVAHSRVLRQFAPLLPAVITWAARLGGASSPVSLAVIGVTSAVYLGCAWKKKDQELWVQKILAGSAAGGFLALSMVGTASAVMCCGMCIDKVKTNTTRFGVIIIVFAQLAMMIPYGASRGACSTVDDEICKECAKVTSPSGPCTPAEKKAIEDSCNALGFLVVYVAAYGWVAVIFGGVASCMGCCAICGCSDCKLGEANNPNRQPIVGQPVPGQQYQGQNQAFYG